MRRQKPAIEYEGEHCLTFTGKRKVATQLSSEQFEFRPTVHRRFKYVQTDLFAFRTKLSMIFSAGRGKRVLVGYHLAAAIASRWM